ncbi:MAG: EVE domain-containing protein [Planctomycetes bacterium]|nr:EVE domain-containing protein [Planctomycetota bacterium]
MSKFLLKTEPTEYSFDDLDRDRHTVWDGITNGLAQKHIASMREGDELIIYHSGDERQAVGLAHVVRGPYTDPNHKETKLHVVNILVDRRFPKPVTLAEIKLKPAFANFDLLKLPRLSVVPMSDEHYVEILKMSGSISRR